jgi:spore coat protein H
LKIRIKKKSAQGNTAQRVGLLQWITLILLVLVLLGTAFTVSVSLFNLYLHSRNPGSKGPAKDFIYDNKAKYLTSRKIKMLDLENPFKEHGDSINRTRLPVIELIIPENSMKVLSDTISEAKLDPERGIIIDTPQLITGVGDFKWPLVPAKLKYLGKTYDVLVKHRGWNVDHYRLHKKSWRIRFDKKDLFHGLHEVNIVNQRVPTVFQDVLQGDLLRQAGMLAPYQQLVHLRVNGQYAGVQTFFSQPDNYFLTKHNRSEGDVYGEKDVIRSFQALTDVNSWQKYASWRDKDDFTSLDRLMAALKKKGTPAFRHEIEKVLDVDYYITYLADAAITAKVNPSSHNNRLYYDPGLGKFQILPWYQMSYFYYRSFENYFHNPLNREWENNLSEFDLDRIRPVDLILNDTMDALVQIPEYHQMYYRMIWKLINSTHSVEAILQLVDYYSDLIREDVRADAHIHDGPFQGAYPTHYISDKRWEKYVEEMKAMIVARDKYIRKHLDRCDLSASLIPDSNKSAKEGGRVIGKLHLYTSEMVRPLLENVILDMEGLSGNPSEKIFIFRENDPIGQAISGSIDPRSGKVVFKINRTVAIDTEKLPYTSFGIRGLLVDDYWDGAIMKALPSIETYTIALEGTSGGKPSSIKLNSVMARNSITRQTLKVQLTKTPRMHALDVQQPPEAGRESIEIPGLGFLKAKRHAPSKEVLWQGNISIEEDTVFESDTLLKIMPGTVVEFAAGKALLSYGQIVAKGTEEQKIIFKPHGDAPRGVVSVNAPGLPPSIFEHCIFLNSANATVEGVFYSGSLSVYSGDVVISNCLFKDNPSDDGLNTKYSRASVSESSFINNNDAIDYDFTTGEIRNSTFRDSSGDSIDISLSKVGIYNNTISGGGDKGISVGEKSYPVIFNNLIYDNDMGIAVKDLSKALILNNTITRNRLGVALYIKKFKFGPSSAQMINNIIWGNSKGIEARDESVVTVQYSNVETPLEGEGNISSDPLFESPDENDFRLKKDSPCIGRGTGRDISDYLPTSGLTLSDMGMIRNRL